MNVMTRPAGKESNTNSHLVLCSRVIRKQSYNHKQEYKAKEEARLQVPSPLLLYPQTRPSRNTKLSPHPLPFVSSQYSPQIG